MISLRRSRLLADDAGSIIAEFRIASFPHSVLQPLDEEHTDIVGGALPSKY